MKCTHCQREIDDDSVFCEYCGERVAKKTTVESAKQVLDSAIKVRKAINERKRTAVGWYNKCIKQYVDFNTRARRKEFWWFTLCNVIYGLTALLCDAVVFGSPIILIIYNILVLVPSIAVGVRRLHDIGKSGWYMLLELVPIVGELILIYWACQDSEAGANQWGKNPKID